MKRRTLLKAAVTTAQLSLLVGAGAMLPRRLLAEWPADAFQGENLGEVEKLLFGEQGIEDSDLVKIDAPDIAENGSNVPVEVRVELPAVESVTLLSDTNPFPLLARGHFTPEVAPRLALRVKLGGTGNLIALAEADGKLYRATRPVKVTAGGCGG